MSEPPVVDDRSRAALLEELLATADRYADEWDPHSEDVGTTLFEVFARFEADVLQRLNAVPEKHRIAFLDALGFDRRPPQAARLPLTFETATDVDRNVVVPGGTQAIASTEDGGTAVFEVPHDAGFEATPATLTDVFGVDPEADAIVDHGATLEEEEAPVTLFTGRDRQRHRLYLGHDDLLTLAGGSTITVTLLTNTVETLLTESMTWECYCEDEAGEVGWHPLARETESIQDLSESDASLPDLREALRERIQEYTTGDPSEWGDNTFELTFRLPGETHPTPVDGVESRWLRATVPGRDPDAFGIEIESVAVTVNRGSEDDGLAPDDLLSNDVPLSVAGDEPLRPFGRSPQPPATLYVASEEALTKPGATASLEFTAPEEAEEQPMDDTGDGPTDDEVRLSPTVDYGVAYGEPELSWEYWNGDGWARLALQEDGTDAFTAPGTVSFQVPPDLEATAVSGHEGHWVRARLVSGNYGQPRYEITEEGTRGDLVERPEPPRFGDLQVRYDRGGVAFEHVVTDNNLTYRHVPPGVETDAFVPFVRVPEETQTLYIGFDAPLRDGPVPLYLPVQDRSYPPSFDPGVRWEYCPAPGRNSWEKLDVQDGTDSLTERGVLLVNVPDETSAFERFGRSRHWVRARVTGDEFQGHRSGPNGEADRPRDAAGNAERSATDSTEERTQAPPPTVEAIRPNTQWADNARTIENETLGSSDGSPDQTFQCANAPVTEIAVWVDELPDLSEAQRRDLAAERPSDVERVQTAGETVHFWVRWTEVADFLDSTKTDRHYTVDRTEGVVTFGDGQRGAIPTADDASIRATYKTGGGSEGNVEAGAVGSLKTPIALVDSVTNLEPGDGGADVETMEAATARAAGQLRSGGRAVTARDFESVSRAASRELARVTCVPQLAEDERQTTGEVTLVVVPRERRDRPTPSVDLRQRVRDEVSERAPAGLATDDGQQIVVRGPRYVPVSVEAELSTVGAASITTLKEVAEARLDAYFHPLTGGRDGEGWEFGAPPQPAEVGTVLEAVDGVAGVERLTVRVGLDGERTRVAAGRRLSLPEDALVCTGSHEFAVTTTEGRPRTDTDEPR